MVEKLFQDPYLKEQNSAYLWINSQKFHAVCFYCTQSGGLSNYIKTKRSGTNLPASSSALFLKENISLVIIY